MTNIEKKIIICENYKPPFYLFRMSDAESPPPMVTEKKARGRPPATDKVRAPQLQIIVSYLLRSLVTGRPQIMLEEKESLIKACEGRKRNNWCSFAEYCQLFMRATSTQSTQSLRVRRPTCFPHSLPLDLHIPFIWTFIWLLFPTLSQFWPHRKGLEPHLHRQDQDQQHIPRLRHRNRENPLRQQQLRTVQREEEEEVQQR